MNCWAWNQVAKNMPPFIKKTRTFLESCCTPSFNSFNHCSTWHLKSNKNKSIFLLFWINTLQLYQTINVLAFHFLNTQKYFLEEFLGPHKIDRKPEAPDMTNRLEWGHQAAESTAKVRPQEQSGQETTPLHCHQYEESPVILGDLGHQLKVQVLGGGIQWAKHRPFPQPGRSRREDILLSFFNGKWSLTTYLICDFFQVAQVFIYQVILPPHTHAL